MKTTLRAMAVLFGASALLWGADRAEPPKPPRAEESARGKEGGRDHDRRGGRDRRKWIESIWQKRDTDQNGGISFAEFSASQRLKDRPEEDRRRIFDHLDKNGDGEIRLDELDIPPGPPPGRTSGERRWDLNRDGKVTFEEFKQIHGESGRDEEQLRRFFAHMDHNNDGVFDEKDRQARRYRRPFMDPRHMLRLDEDKDGRLSFEEWKKAPPLQEVDPPKLQEIFGRIDRDGDGFLTPKDWPEGRGPKPDGRGRPEGGPRPDSRSRPDGDRPRRPPSKVKPDPAKRGEVTP